MQMDLSKQAAYAIQAMAYLAERRGRLVPIRKISESVDAPLPFLAKILSTLSRNGIVIARRGPKGGVMLSRPPAEISLGEVVAVLDGPETNGRCFLGLDSCSESNPCPVHESWRKACNGMARAMRERTLEDLQSVRSRIEPR